MEEVVLRESGPGRAPAAVPDEYFAVETEEYEAVGEDPGQPAKGERDPSELGRDFDVFVNPFLGSGSLLSKALGLKETYQCGECGGQVCLRVTRDPRLEGKVMVGKFLCSRCDPGEMHLAT